MQANGKVPRMGTVSLFAVLALGGNAGAHAALKQEALKTYLLKGARVIVRPGTVRENTDILLSDGKIARIGSNISAPQGAEVIDCNGLTAYPGLIHPFLRVSVDGVVPSTTGLTPAELAARRDADPMGRTNNLLCGKKTAELKQKDVGAFASLGKSGYALAQISASGGLVGSPAAVVSLAGKDLDPSGVVLDSGSVPLSFSRGGFGGGGGGGGGGGYPGSTMGCIAFVRQALLDAGRYGRLKKTASKPNADAAMEALEPVASGTKAAVFDDLNEVSYFEAKKISSEFNLRPIYAFRNSSGWVIDELKGSGASIVLKGDVPAKPRIGENLETVSIANIRGYFNELQAGAELEKKGIAFCYAPSNNADPLEGIRVYVRGGLSKDAALAAVTTAPAGLLGVSDKAGTLEEGKLGNVLLTQGDLFDSSSQVMAVFSSGKRIDFKMPDRKKPDDLKADAPIALMKPNFESFPRPAETKPAFRLYKGATIWTEGPQGNLKDADILIRDGKIVKVGPKIQAPAGCQVIDARGKHISPGIWDCHSHTGVSGGVNEGSNMITVECRIADVIDHRAIGIYRQLSGGTVGAQQLHGSANAIGGQTSPVKWRWGERPTEFPIAGAPPGVKFALGENPIREDTPRGGPNQQPTPDGGTLLTFRPRTRMGVEEAIRRGLELGKEYDKTWHKYRAGKITVEPRRDLQLEGLAEIATGKRLIHSHGYRADELLMLLRVTKEFGARVATLQHVLEGYKIADEMAQQGVGGSTFADWWGYKLEAYDAIPYNAALMADRGVSVSVNSDSDNHARRLNHEAAKSIRYGGVSPEKALSFVTIEPAKQMGIASHTGSLEAGKDADLAIWSGDPTSIYAVCLETYVDGVKRFDRKDDLKQREERSKELQEAKKVLEGEGAASNPFAAGPSTASSDGNGNSGASTAKFGLGPVTGKPGTMRYPRKAVLIAGATVHPMSGAPFVGDVLIGPDGRIKSVGKNLSSASAVRVDAKGKHLYPGLIDPATTLGIAEIGQVPVSDDSAEKGDFHPDYKVERTINPEWQTLAVARQQGVLTAVVKPGGSGIGGKAALIHTEGFTFEDYCVQGDLAFAVALGGGGPLGGEEESSCDDGDLLAGIQGRRGQGGAGGGAASALERQSTQLTQTRDYIKKRSEATPEKPVPQDLRYEALVKSLDGRVPFMLNVNSASDIKSVVAWAEKEKVRVLLYGCSGAGEIAEWLAEKKVPIVLAGVFGMPDADRPTEYFYNLPAKLKKAGVKYCLSTNDAHNVRQLRDQAGFSAAFGMDREDAVRSITLWTAEMLGVSNRIGAIKPGLEGTVILTDGDILDTKTHVLRAWIDGREISLKNKQTELFEKYKNRPKIFGK